MQTPKRVLVTGGAGLLGSHLCERLLVEGHEVICLDNFFTGEKRNIEHLVGHPRFQMMIQDVCEPFFISTDQVYHLACPASPIHYQRYPVITVKTCIMGSLNVLNLALEMGARVLLASTSEIYGDPAVHPQPESYWGNVNPTGIRSCYNEGKRCAETLFDSYARQHGTEVRIARIFNTYGPKLQDNDGRVISNFIVQALKGEPLTIYGSGAHTRSFCYVSDMIDGLLLLTNSEISSPVNIGNPEEISILSLAELIIKLTRSRSTIVHKALPKDDPVRRRPDITLMKDTLGWEPVVSLSDGLTRTIEYFSKRISNEEMQDR